MRTPPLRRKVLVSNWLQAISAPNLLKSNLPPQMSYVKVGIGRLESGFAFFSPFGWVLFVLRTRRIHHMQIIV